MAIKLTDPKLLAKYGKKPEPIEEPKPDNTERLIQVLIDNNERLVDRLQPEPQKPVNLIAEVKRDKEGRMQAIHIKSII